MTNTKLQDYQTIASLNEITAAKLKKTKSDLKDELIRQTIMDTQEDVEQILDKLDKLDERIYEMQKNR